MDLDLEGNVAVVAASSTGLGRASARAFAEEGANVVVNGRDAETLEATTEELGADATGRVVPHAADLTDPDGPASLVERAVDEFGRLDHLVTNAGGPPSGPFLETTDAEWQAAFDGLVMSAVRLVRAAAEPLSADGGGTVVCITSRSVKEALDRLVLSNSVRMAVVGLEKTLSRELAPEVRVNTVMPGTHATGRMTYLIEREVEAGVHDSFEAGTAAWAADTALNRMGDPRRFGQVVAFLSSAPANFVTGAALIVDGGDARSTL